jgi:hypothetical protein
LVLVSTLFGGRFGRGFGGGRGEFQHGGSNTSSYGNWEERRGNFRGGRESNAEWRYRKVNNRNNVNENREQPFDPRDNLNQGREQMRQAQGYQK